MKIEYLEIRNYKQFSDLKLELTYPLGHKREGKPLDKICIIGQSGTGKTNILEIIKKSVIDFSEQPINSYLPFSKFIGKDTDNKYIMNRFITSNGTKGETLFTDKKSKITFDKKCIIEKNEKNYFVDISKMFINNEKINSNRMQKTDKSILESLFKHRETVISNGINFYGLESFSERLKKIDKNIEELEAKYNKIETVSNSLNELKEKNFIDRNIINISDNNNNSWKRLKEKIERYESEKAKYKTKLFNKIMYENEYSKEESIKDMKKWEKSNENLLERISDDINFIITQFNLELIKIDENQTNHTGLTIKDLSNNTIIEYDNLSSGTKNLLSTFIPLKSYTPKNSIIEIDEPENSFYPDIQKELTDLYMNVGENNQLIMATHSPLIASSFEPWEVVELKFDENNQIYREKYYEGENHIDNYTLDPRMLTWTSILTDIFDLKEDSNLSFREQKLMEYAMLKAEIKLMKNEEEREKKIDKLMKLSGLLGLQN